MKLRSIRSARVTGRRVLVRAALNVPLDARGRVRDDWRLRAAIPTLRWLTQQRARVIICGHIGRPKGRVSAHLSLRGVGRHLTTGLKKPVQFIPANAGPVAARAVDKVAPGKIALLENLRFDSGEEANTALFAKRLAALGDIFVNDAFDTVHRPHASMVGVPRLLPAYAGLQVLAEVASLQRIVNRPRRPFVVIIGGAKISTKLGLVQKLLPSADSILLGGALANTLLKAHGIQVGRSLIEPGMMNQVRRLSLTTPKLKIPVDVIVASETNVRSGRQVAVGAVPVQQRIVDIGPDTVALFRSVISQAQTIVWNGTLGLAEYPAFQAGTFAIARRIAASRAFSVVGGGETIEAIRNAGLEKRFDFLSTGGGAMLAFLEGQALPGLIPLIIR